MNNKNVKLILLLTVFACILTDVSAQRSGRRRGSTNPPSTTQQDTVPTQQVTNVNAPRPGNAYGNLPIEVLKSDGGFTDSVKPSLRPDAAYDKLFMKDRTPLPYEHIRLDDALYSERVWREIDIREKMNQVFSYKTEDDNGSQQFINILVRALRTPGSGVTAFSADDDRFTTPLDSAGIERALSGGGQCDTTAVYDLNDPTKIVKWVVSCETLNPDQIVKFRIKEDWVFDRESSRMVCRILGIAPMKTLLSPDKKTERGAIPMFWVYYPDLRPTLTKYEVYNPKNMGQSRMTWEELFESRMFTSYIIKSTLDNPNNRYLRNVYPKDPILALLEGDNIKEKIFNYEQDLWSY
jgi:gliding motility associated protien GldN